MPDAGFVTHAEIQQEINHLLKKSQKERPSDAPWIRLYLLELSRTLGDIAKARAEDIPPPHPSRTLS
jgi:hypothetical protein